MITKEYIQQLRNQVVHAPTIDEQQAAADEFRRVAREILSWPLRNEARSMPLHPETESNTARSQGPYLSPERESESRRLISKELETWVSALHPADVAILANSLAAHSISIGVPVIPLSFLTETFQKAWLATIESQATSMESELKNAPSLIQAAIDAGDVSSALTMADDYLAKNESEPGVLVVYEAMLDALVAKRLLPERERDNRLKRAKESL